MEAEIIAIGDELTSGQRLDTNSQWLSQQLGHLGISTVRHTAVGDNIATNIEALRAAASRVQFVVCTGGLGPTLDDLTRQAMAEAFDAPLTLDNEILERIRKMFSDRNREMPERNRVQAMFPSGSQEISNPHGSAPGIDFAVTKFGNACRIFALPGVPAEMKQMWQESVVPRIETQMGNTSGPLMYRVLKLFGIGESDVEVRLPDLIHRERVPTVGITVSRATITLRIAGRGKTEADFEQLIAPTLQEIHNSLGDLVFGEGDDELEHAVMRELRSTNRSLASLEIGAASWINDWMLQVAEEEASHFRGGIAFPNLEAASVWLNASDGTTDSDNVCKDLCGLVRERFQADIGLAVGVYPTMKQMQAASQALDFFFAVTDGSRTHVERRAMGGHPDVLGPRVAKTALDITLRWLRGL